MEVDFESVRKRRNESSDEDGSSTVYNFLRAQHLIGYVCMYVWLHVPCKQLKRGKASVNRGRGRGRGRGRASVAGTTDFNQSTEMEASENDLFSAVKTQRIPIEVYNNNTV